MITNDTIAQFVGSFLIIVLSRYLLEMATPEHDIKELEKMLVDLKYFNYRLRWYRGFEVLHQWRGERLIHAVFS